jgi:hypothetical protein
MKKLALQRYLLCDALRKTKGLVLCLIVKYDAFYGSGGYDMKETGEYYKLHYSRVSRIAKMAKNKT